MKILIQIILLTVVLIRPASAFQSKKFTIDTLALPKVLVIGEMEDAYERMTLQHKALLLNACNKDVDVAFKYWYGMMQEVQNFADKSGFEIKGAKMWINVFFLPNGSIKHIAYYLKPNSRNIKEQELKGFFMAFMNQYKLPLTYSNAFSHYGSVSFPLTSDELSNGN